MVRVIRIIGTLAVCLFVISTLPAFAQRGRPGGRPDGQGQQDRQRGGADRQSDDRQRARPRDSERGQAAVSERQRPGAARERPQTPVHEGEPIARPDREREQVRPGRVERREYVPQRAMPRGQASYAREAHSERDVRVWQERRGWQRPGVWRERPTWQMHRAGRWDVDHRTWIQRGGYGGYFIPDSHFHLYFGVGHYFRIRTRPIIVAGYPRFMYRGYWFMLVDPWPEFWPVDWYMNDDVYIDYDDGYYLYNRRRPGVAIAVSVVF